MDDKLHNLIDDARRGVVLTADEKAAGRRTLEQYMLLTPVRAASVPAKRRFGFVSPVFAGRTAGVFSLVLGLMLSSAGISYAAEGSLPGDALYTVKVGVNEELTAALAPTPEAKAAWEAERAERRLAEAETLAQKGKLKAETRVALESDFKRHAEKAKAGIAQIAVSADEATAADVAAHLEGSLRAHKQIIAALASSEAGGAVEVGRLAISVDAETDATVKERSKTEAKVSEQRAADAEASAQGRRQAAQNKIAEVRAYLSAKRGELGAEATMAAEARVADAGAALADGDAKLAAGDFAAAFAAYGKAQRTAQEAKLLIRARHDLKIRLNADDRGADDGKKTDEERSRDGEEGASRGGTDVRADVRTQDSVRVGSREKKDGARVDARLRVDVGL